MVSHFCQTLTFLIFILLADGSLGHSGGAPHDACKDLEPGVGPVPSGHGDDIAPQTTPPPYRLLFNRTKMNSDTTHEIEGHRHIKMSILADPGEEFKGFLVVVKKKGTDGYKTLPGTWKDLQGKDARTVDCNQGGIVTAEAWTHRSNEPKKITSAYWKPENEDGEFEVYFTVVKSLKIYWKALQTPNYSSIKVIKTNETEELYPYPDVNYDGKPGVQSNGLALIPNPVAINILLLMNKYIIHLSITQEVSIIYLLNN